MPATAAVRFCTSAISEGKIPLAMIHGSIQSYLLLVSMKP